MSPAKRPRVTVVSGEDEEGPFPKPAPFAASSSSPPPPPPPAVAAASPITVVATPPTSPKKSSMPASPSRAVVVDVPAGRPSLLRPAAGADPHVALFSVFEMPYPVEEMMSVLAIAKTLRPEDPLLAFPEMQLVGPFEVLLEGRGYVTDRDKWRDWRFFYDPPEVQTLIVMATAAALPPYRPDQVVKRISLHRDDPSSQPSMVVVGGGPMDNAFEIAGESICAAMLTLLPPTHPAAVAIRSARGATQLGRPGETVKRARLKTSLARTYHNLGVLCPYDKKTEVGYRPMMLTLTQLKQTVVALNHNTATPKQRDGLEEQFQYADIANDECDFGLNLELGLNLFSLVQKDNEVMRNMFRVLDIAYALLGRSLFQHVLALHVAEGGVMVTKKVVVAPRA